MDQKYSHLMGTREFFESLEGREFSTPRELDEAMSLRFREITEQGKVIPGFAFYIKLCNGMHDRGWMVQNENGTYSIKVLTSPRSN
jgi:hypothetical protein